MRQRKESAAESLTRRNVWFIWAGTEEKMLDDVARLVREVRYLRWFYANAPVDVMERRRLQVQYEQEQERNIILAMDRPEQVVVS